MADLIKCLWCLFHGTQTDFPFKPNLQYLKTCTTCNAKQNKSAGKNHLETPGGLPTFSWNIFNQLLMENKDSMFNNLSSLAMALQHILQR
ncbi:hypothetical protein L208DRAFT_1399270 [Tricholoma matsutake]|nr:hypothetical protein L208DRAFT_1399270 [Tricholoma matsutake 945]